MSLLTEIRKRFHSSVGEELLLEESLLDHILSAYLCGYHVLLEGAPGVGKTTLASCLGSVVGDFGRVQMTSDMSPSDIIGMEVLDPENPGNTFFRKGPLFNRILLVDEINRALPRTQSALLQAMEERKVSVGEVQYSLSPDFFVIATQNPYDMDGTFLLPASQRDRFGISLKVDLPGGEALRNILSFKLAQASTPARDSGVLGSFTREWESLEIKEEWLKLAESLQLFLQEKSEDSLSGALPLSPRGWLSWLEMGRCLSFLRGNTHISTACMREILLPTTLHRMSAFRSTELAPLFLAQFDASVGL